MLLGGISLHLAVFGAFLATSGKVSFQPAVHQQESDQQKSNAAVSQSSLAEHRCSSLRVNLFKDLDLRLLGVGGLWALAVMMCCTFFAHNMWVIYFVSQAQSNGFSAEQAGWFVSVASIGDVMGKVVQGPLTDHGIISSWSLTAVLSILCSVAFCATPWLTSYWAAMATAFIVLFCSGVIACQADVLIKQVFLSYS